MVNRGLSVFGKILLDLTSLFIVFIPWIVLHTFNQPYKRGFYCNDESIRYPYKSNTVKSDVLTGVSFVLAILVISITESIHHFIGYDIPDFQITESRFIPHFLARIYKYFVAFLFGLAVQQTLINIGKYTIGRLRPHFIDVCKPQFSSINCTQAGMTADIFIYVDQYSCQNLHTYKDVDARLSFPSGHSSFSTFVAIFLSLYLQSRIIWRSAVPLRVIVQVFMVYGAFYTCLSRITDHKHHPTDVLTGALLGAFVAYIAGVYGCDLFKPKVTFINPKPPIDNSNYSNNPPMEHYNHNRNNNNNNNNNNNSYNGNVAINLEENPVRVHVN